MEAGQIVMVHSSVRSLGRIVGGPDTVIRALLDALTGIGTIMIYVSWEEWKRRVGPACGYLTSSGAPGLSERVSAL